MAELADISDALASLATRQAAYHKYGNYYAGRHQLQFATDAFRQAFGHLFRTMTYNRCRAVVDAFADRLIVEGWESPNATESENDALGAAAMDVWDRTRMPKRQGELITESLRAGDAYLIVWPGEDGAARLDINRGHLIEPVYDDEYPERMLHAVKCWRVTYGPDRGKWRVNCYDAERITRWITTNVRDDRPDDGKGLIPYEDETGAEIFNEWGVVPVFAFGNDASTGGLGTSELSDVIPLQDGLNKNLNDMMVVAEYAAYPQRYAVGVDAVYNPQTGKEEEVFKPGVDRVWAVGDPDAKFGEFGIADMGQFVAAQDAWDHKISRVSRVPIHWLSLAGDTAFPSGEALKTAEGPFVAKLKDRQVAFGAALSDAMTFALRIDRVIGDGGAEFVVPIWQAAETRSDLEALQQAALKSSLGIPQEQIWAELGYSQDEVTRFTALKQAEAERQAEMFAQQFDRGGNAPFGG